MLELLAVSLSFLGGLILTIDALLIKKSIRIESGAADLREMLEEADVDESSRPKPLRSEKELRLWLANLSLVRTWWGFLLMALGFLLELVAAYRALP